MGEILKRLKSPVLWVAVVGLIYSTAVQPVFADILPDWTSIVGFVAAIFGIANNPADKQNF